jgi:hypothetical protein
MLEVIIQRANLQTTGTIYNKEAQLLAYADKHEWRESENTTKKPDYKKVLLQTAQTSAVEPLFTPDKIHNSQDLEPLSPALRQWDVGVDQKGEKSIARIWEKGVRKRMNRKRYNHELDKEFNSPNALNVKKTSRLRYVDHMIRRPEDLPQKALFRAKLNERRNQGRPKSR